MSDAVGQGETAQYTEEGYARHILETYKHMEHGFEHERVLYKALQMAVRHIDFMREHKNTIKHIEYHIDFMIPQTNHYTARNVAESAYRACKAIKEAWQTIDTCPDDTEVMLSSWPDTCEWQCSGHKEGKKFYCGATDSELLFDDKARYSQPTHWRML